MEWTDETIARLKALWQEGLSTAEIGRQLGITKNAVVGKAHRLALPPRPSPIRRQAAKTGAAAAPKTGTETAAEPKAAPKRASRSAAAKKAAEDKPVAKAEKTAPAPAAPSAPVASAPAAPAETPAPRPQRPKATPAASVPAAPAPKAAAPARPASTSTKSAASKAALRGLTRDLEPRRRGPSCCWPIGDPGTPGFHFCGATPLPGKPYCAEHAALAYVKLRDRRDGGGS